MSNQLGKRYTCKECGAEVLCTKAGDGSIYCCQGDMDEKQPVSLPTAD